jgi:hypothetical protein
MRFSLALRRVTSRETAAKLAMASAVSAAKTSRVRRARGLGGRGFIVMRDSSYGMGREVGKQGQPSGDKGLAFVADEVSTHKRPSPQRHRERRKIFNR